MVGQILRNLLINDSDITDIVDNNIFPQFIPLKSENDLVNNIPAITYSITSVETEQTNEGDVFEDKITTEVISYSRSYEDTQNLIYYIRKALRCGNGIYNNIRVKDVRFISGNDEFNNLTETHGHRMTFIFYTKTT